MIETILRITLSLAVVLVLMWLLAKVARRPLAGRGGDTVAVLARQQLTRGTSVAVVRVADRALVLGVTDAQITLLAETDPATVERAREGAEQREPVALDADGADRPLDDDLSGLDESTASPLAGSALSPRTWTAALDVLRERTARK
ncbi:flagellar biosynthetic protein FliO [Actinomadura hibisca]|uniref:flagellar biosynthetic protein FliO n=1 Tax=Actinomadura hibisca TaxID=68565 RepID=UPI00082D5787|nr:flagellar biosynthetic protein FliO [Actinomadura hibisca]